MTHQPTVTKNYKNTQSEFDSNLGSCDVSVAPRAVRLSTSPGTQLLLLLKGNSDVPLFFHFLNYPPDVCKPSKNCHPAALSYPAAYDSLEYSMFSIFATLQLQVDRPEDVVERCKLP